MKIRNLDGWGAFNSTEAWLGIVFLADCECTRDSVSSLTHREHLNHDSAIPSDPYLWLEINEGPLVGLDRRPSAS